ncbi:hypothetical protein BEN48_02850 [Hymenobacter glacialis]|uniref:Uncharacterized protein n=2 Tax=Hymenobacter glacialis TaxID=1908236 RepID=A0A1G1T1E1_9BACT|nr:hypothetical protein BEN48_02850 [Hymenobacter glacialis]
MTNAKEDFNELMGFLQQNRAAISRAIQIRDQAMERIAFELREALAATYVVLPKKDENMDGWLIIEKPGKHSLKYILSYYYLFHEGDDAPNYRIALLPEDGNIEKAKYWRDVLSTTEQARLHKIEPDIHHYVIGKTYQVTSNNYQNFPQVVADALRNDWQPLEQYWLIKDTE